VVKPVTPVTPVQPTPKSEVAVENV
jgi:hypothetical protein